MGIEAQHVLLVQAADLCPSFDLWTVMILSTIKKEAERKPVFSGWLDKGSFKRGVMTLEVNPQRVTELVSLNRSS